MSARALIKQTDRPEDFEKFLRDMERETVKTFAKSRKASATMKAAIARSKGKKTAPELMRERGTGRSRSIPTTRRTEKRYETDQRH